MVPWQIEITTQMTPIQEVYTSRYYAKSVDVSLATVVRVLETGKKVTHLALQYTKNRRSAGI